MEVLVDRIAGLDVHKDTVMACVRTPGAGRKRSQVIRAVRCTGRRDRWGHGEQAPEVGRGLPDEAGGGGGADRGTGPGAEQAFCGPGTDDGAGVPRALARLGDAAPARVNGGELPTQPRAPTGISYLHSPRAPVADRDGRSFHASPAEVARQVRPGRGRSPAADT
jgi:hypothetical protein